MTALDAGLVRVYEATDYVLETPNGETILRIGLPTDVLELHGGGTYRSGCFVTACNPFGRPLDTPENAKRNLQLAEYIKSRGWTLFHGEGRGSTGDWAPEESFLALGPDEHDAVSLCERFEQNAVVFMQRGLPPFLIFHPRFASERP